MSEDLHISNKILVNCGNNKIINIPIKSLWNHHFILKILYSCFKQYKIAFKFLIDGFLTTTHSIEKFENFFVKNILHRKLTKECAKSTRITILNKLIKFKRCHYKIIIHE